MRRLDPSGVRVVLDAGAGTGRDTAMVLDAIPGARVIAVDGSAAMLARLRSRLGGRASRVSVVRADLRERLPLRGPVDAIFSVATFHWIGDHAALFRHLAEVLRRGGRLVSECGGEGNLEQVNTAIEGVLGASPRIWSFAGVRETRERLAAAGFTRIEVGLRADPTRLGPGDQLRRYLKTVVLGTHVRRVPPERQDDVVAVIASRLAEPAIDYVRLEISAVRA